MNVKELWATVLGDETGKMHIQLWASPDGDGADEMLLDTYDINQVRMIATGLKIGTENIEVKIAPSCPEVSKDGDLDDRFSDTAYIWKKSDGTVKSMNKYGDYFTVNGSDLSIETMSE